MQIVPARFVPPKSAIVLFFLWKGPEMKNQNFQSNNRRSRRRENALQRKSPAYSVNVPYTMTFRLPPHCDAFTLLSGMLNCIADEVHSKSNG